MRNIAVYQARLLLRSPVFAAAVLALFALVAVGVVDRVDGAHTALAPVRIAIAVATSSHEMVVLVFMVLAAWAGAVARSGRAVDMVDSYWHSNTEMVVGQALGLAVVFAAVWFALLAWGTGLAWVLIGKASASGVGATAMSTGSVADAAVVAVAELGRFWLRQALPAAVMGAGAGYAAGFIVGSQLAAYPVAVALWFALVMGSMEIARSIRFRWLGVLDMSSAHEFDRWLTALATAAAGWLGVGLAAGTVKRRRESTAGRRRASGLALITGVLLFALAFGTSWARWAPRAAMSRASVAAAAEESAWPREVRSATDVRSYDMEVHLSPRDGTLQNIVIMHVVNAGQEPLGKLAFTLKAEFTVESCQVRRPPPQPADRVDAQGEGAEQDAGIAVGATDAWTDVSVERVASGLWIPPGPNGPLQPGQACEVRVSYGGPVHDWRLGRFLWLSYELHAVVAPAGTWIPAGSAWYPVGGARPTRYVMSTGGVVGAGASRGGPANTTAVWMENSHPTARMKVTVYGAGNVNTGIPGRLVSADGGETAYMFESSKTRDLYLTAGGSYGSEIVLSPRAREYVERRWRFLEELSPSESDLVMAELPSSSLLVGSTTPEARLAPPGVMLGRASSVEHVAGAAVTSSFDRNTVDNLVLDAWWPAGGIRWEFGPWLNSNVMSGVLQYARVLFLEHEGDHATAQTVMEDARRGPPGRRDAMLLLDQTQRDHGLEVVKQVYRTLRAGQAGRDGVVTMQDLQDAVNKAAGRGADAQWADR
jgi:hypothetical protein